MPDPQSAVTGQDLQPVYHDDYHAIARQSDFLDAAFHGGTMYKNARDMYGLPVLIPHENEVGAEADGPWWQVVGNRLQGLAKDISYETLRTRYGRRKRTAVYENHLRPIIQKIFGYTIRAVPSRPESMADRLRSMDWDNKIKEVLYHALVLDHYWIGLDMPTVETTDGDGTDDLVTRQQQLDAGAGDPYFVLVDPRRVVDWESNDAGEVTRVVIMECQTSKATFTSKPETTVYYLEWRIDGWTRWREEANEDGKRTLVVEGEGPNPFERVRHGVVESFVPYWRFDPPFPTVDLAEMNRLLFNVMSLLDEELFNCTFTQKVVSGASPEDVKKAVQGGGNILALRNAQAKLVTVGAIVGQAESLAARVDQLRDSMYWLANLEGTHPKNAPEAAEKKKRDLETLYTMLVAIVDELQRLENVILWSLGELESPDDENGVNYPRKFDVSSATEIIDELRSLVELPFIPAQVKREKMKELINHLFPLEDNDELMEAVDGLPDVSEPVVSAIERLQVAGAMGPELMKRLLALPDDLAAEFDAEQEAAKEHERQMEAEAMRQRELQLTGADDEGEEFDREAQAREAEFA